MPNEAVVKKESSNKAESRPASPTAIWHLHRPACNRLHYRQEPVIKVQKSSYLSATMHRPPTNLPASLAADLDQKKHRHLHALRAVSPAQKQQFGK